MKKQYKKYLSTMLKAKHYLFSSKNISFKLRKLSNRHFKCPICVYQGPFQDLIFRTGARKHAKCPRCGSLERHRLQKLVLDELSKKHDFSKMNILHFAPEFCLKKYFKRTFNNYHSADLYLMDVDYNIDLRKLPFNDAEYDFVFASHVLEHIKDDLSALSEIRRVLRPGGIAILPVPIIAEKTIEYPAPCTFEEGHVRAPGYNYHDRYREYFSYIEIYSSSDFPSSYQTFIYEEREHWPTKEMPLRKRMLGEKHIDMVPVCYA